MVPNISYRRAGSVLAISIIAAVLSACATQSPPRATDPYAWQQHRQQLDSLAAWSFRGRLAIKQPGDSWSASLRWQQENDSYDIRLSGAFGQGGARLFGHDGYAVIETKDHAALTANSAEMLMQEQLGWHVPVRDLKHWLIGSPGAGLSERQTLDAMGRLLEMEQAGWQIRYRSYTEVDGLALPRKLELENGQLRARLVIDEWSLDRGEEG